MATLAVKSLSSRVRVFVQVIRRESEGHLRRAAADQVIIADKYTGQLLANCAVAPNISRVLDTLLNVAKGPYFKSMKPPGKFVGSTFEDLSLHLKRSQNCILVGFVTEESILRVDDILSDDISSVDAFIQKKLLEAGHSPEELETAFVNLNPPSEDLYILFQGTLEVSQQLTLSEAFDSKMDKRDKMLIRLKAESYPVVGEMTLFEDHIRSATMKAMGEVTMGVISKVRLMNLARDNPRIGFHLFYNIGYVLSERLKKANSDILKLSTAFSLALEKGW